MLSKVQIRNARIPGCRCSLRRWLGSLNRQKLERRQLLEKVYAPFSALTKGGPEYVNLADSGRVWEGYFDPANSKRYKYTLLQKEFADILSEIDEHKQALRLPSAALAKSLVAEYAHQSVQIENNTLPASCSIQMTDQLCSRVFATIPGFGALSSAEVWRITLPSAASLAEGGTSQVNELRNHIVASYWTAEHATLSPGTAGLDELDVRNLAGLMVRDTNGEPGWGWGKRVALGEYRALPIGVKSNALRIFPYPQEVPALMRRFFQWRDETHANKKLHPLILACQAKVYFLYIHPFPDGNGRTARLLMQDYLLRQGYLPAALQGIESKEYVRMISDAQDERPHELVACVLGTQLDIMRTLIAR